MSWKEYWLNLACKTADRRKRSYGIDPSPRIASLLERQKSDITAGESTRLLFYVLIRSPQHRLRLLWRFLTDRDTPVRKQQIDALAHDLEARLSEGCRVATSFFERRIFSRDLARVPPFMETILHRTTPCLVVQPQSESDIAAVLELSRSRDLAVFPRGSGSFAFGGSVPTRNGILVDLSPMMAILEIDADRMTVRVQPGARWADIAIKLDPYGLMPMTTPTSRFSTVGGWISTGGMGLDSYGYGSVFAHVAAVRVVRPDGNIEELDSRRESLQDLLGTEGQLGILSEITLRVRPKPEYSGASLLTFADPEEAMTFIENFTRSGHKSSHVVFFDREYMARENHLFREHAKQEEPIVPESDAVLLHFETEESEEGFISSLNGKERQLADNRVAARYLWADRYFPLKAQRIGPGLLGAEVVVPAAKVNKYIDKVRTLARRFHAAPTIEVIVCRSDETYSYLVIISFSCDYSRSVHYHLSLLLIQLLVQAAAGCGGYPYGIGIWNTPFVGKKFSRDRLRALREKKTRIDPRETLNPNKFFKIKGRFFSIPAAALRPSPFRLILAISRFFTPILGGIARLFEPERRTHWEIPSPEDNHGEKLLRQSALRCTSCGSCISVCPAYHITRDELVTGRSKLRMGEAMQGKAAMIPKHVHSPFQCLHCGLCEEVCQTRLPLRDCYLVLENWIENRYGLPYETVKGFVEKLDENREFIKNIFGLDLPAWSPDLRLSRVPAVERDSTRDNA